MKRNKRRTASEEQVDFGGFFGGLGALLEKLGELAEKGGELNKSGEIRGLDPEGKARGVFGFRVKVGLGDQGIQVERFGNLRKDEKTGQAVVHQTREPMVDLFDEQDHLLVVAEMPGISQEDVKLDLKEDILTIAAETGEQRYRKDVLLPAAFPQEKMRYTCRNGVVEVKFMK